MSSRNMVKGTPLGGTVAPGYEPVAEVFERQVRRGKEVGAGLAIYVRGECVVNLWGGYADLTTRRPWEQNTRLVLFSVTKGLAAFALNMAADRGLFEWDAPVVQYWPGFGANGKQHVTVRQLFNHQAGLAGLHTRFWLSDFCSDSKHDAIVAALESQAPLWEPGAGQGYHALTFGMYASEFFRRVAGERLEDFLHREILDPVRSDVRLGTPESFDPSFASLYPPRNATRVAGMLRSALLERHSAEARIARAIGRKGSLVRLAFGNPSTGPRGVMAYNDLPVRRAALAWGSGTGSANGLARVYLPLSLGGSMNGRTWLQPQTVEAIAQRQAWSERDLVLEKPLGWSQGFLKEERHLFSPNPESFGHSGMGGALGWCDPVDQVALGYVMNRMDWRVRSPRCVALCRALYECEPLREARRR